jgi:hypothetical protein
MGCNRAMGGVDLKDQKLELFVTERKKRLKWYISKESSV